MKERSALVWTGETLGWSEVAKHKFEYSDRGDGIRDQDRQRSYINWIKHTTHISIHLVFFKNCIVMEHLKSDRLYSAHARSN